MLQRLPEQEAGGGEALLLGLLLRLLVPRLLLTVQAWLLLVSAGVRCRKHAQSQWYHCTRAGMISSTGT